MKKNIILIFILTAFFASCGDNSEVIETLDGNKITVNSFEDTYNVAIDAMSRVQNIEKENLLEFISKDIAEVPEQMRALNYQFQKKNFYDQYRDMMITTIAAEKDGFTKRDDIKKILKFQEMQIVSQLYVMHLVESKIKISEEEAMEECQKLRSKEPQISSLPIDRCILFARAKLKKDKSQEILPKVLERIKEQVAIKHNDKFDLDAFLKKKVGSESDKKESSSATGTAPKTEAPKTTGQ
ncbi:lipoprotein LipL31 [Leptospira noguchii]|uniref:Lipoprotein LipL31 n=2 Tax=Leptospira noguchii TaxID=28182 RepID=A0A9Q8VRB7_9LEPT|nr:lipoprotein LipL31 [Leptospira noguchii]EKR73852.1 putative lipoprotein [Leptospira noguchii str. 2006001870]EMO41996.1 putative lipoprotein [Leptospira noguchii serovar Autumnalis str. ZUN142]EMS82663.1 putative lipoprotein [Leptospira noguchii str. Hook]TQE80373.1 lipoprotein LipL31 [Leptospira noguchii]UOG31737.1 lipoprotein LipL31 [Leptospira noguchii]